jgi:carbon-monoxide dehydrogenase small subunit
LSTSLINNKHFVVRRPSRYPVTVTKYVDIKGIPAALRGTGISGGSMQGNATSNAVTVAMTINGQSVRESVAANMLLSAFLREQRGLTGTHIGCDTSQCGACNVHVNGRCVKSCTMLAAQAEGAEVTTVEGLGTEADLHPMQAAFKEHHALQCGFCTPGMLMTAIELATTMPEAGENEIRAHLEGNLCRCTGYHNIVKAIAAGAREMARSA